MVLLVVATCVGPLFLLLLSSAALQVQGKDCGFPGRPNNGTVLSTEKFFYPGEEVNFECTTGFILFGKGRRTCLEDGSWTDSLPECRYNLALKRTTSQSETLWTYNAELAVDGDPNTCSFTPQSDVQRWWQVHLSGSPRVGSVAITISPGSYQHFTIFVVELMEGNKAMYKPCAKFEGRFQDMKALFNCNENEGHTGHFVYIRDDRKDKEYFGLCEVEVFEHKGTPQCGQPEQPIYGTVKLSGEFAHYSCIPGYTMRGNATRQCQWIGWQGQVPECTEVQCDHPESTKDGFIEVSNFKGSYVYGSRATYHCNPGFILWGNATRICNADGLWTGATPQCQPIACGDPVTFPHASVALLNGSTVWKAIAHYACIHGYKEKNGNASIYESHCLQNGTWTKVDLECVRNPDVLDGLHTVLDKNPGGGDDVDGGFLVGSQFSGGAAGVFGSGAMLIISVVAAVITGTAVAFLIIFIRKWILKWSDSSSHHLIMAPPSGPGSSSSGGGREPDDLHHPYNGMTGYLGNSNTLMKFGGSGPGQPMLPPHTNQNMYSTMPILRAGATPQQQHLINDMSTKNGGKVPTPDLTMNATLSSGDLYQTTNLSTFTSATDSSNKDSSRKVNGGSAPNPKKLGDNQETAASASAAAAAAAAGMNRPQENNEGDEGSSGEEARMLNNAGTDTTKRRHRRQRRNQIPNNARHPRPLPAQLALSRGADGVTTATSLSSSTPSPTSSLSEDEGPQQSAGEGNEDHTDGGKPPKLPPKLSAATRASEPQSGFRYADAKDISTASLRKSCLEPLKSGQGSPKYANYRHAAAASANPQQQLVVASTNGNPNVNGCRNNNQCRGDVGSATSFDPFGAAIPPYATLGRKSGPRSGSITPSSSSIMNCFDPLQQLASEIPEDGGQIILLPPCSGSESIPDILQTLSQQEAVSQSSRTAPLNSASLSLTRSGHLPREPMAVYNAKGSHIGILGNSLHSTAAGHHQQRIPKAEKDGGGQNACAGSSSTTSAPQPNNRLMTSTSKKKNFPSSMEAPLPSVPRESYISVINSNVDQNI